MSEKVERKQKNLEDTFSITMELQRPLLKDEDDKEHEEKIKHKKYKLKKQIKTGIIVVVAILIIGIINWISTSYKPGQLALDSLVSDDKVEVNIDNNITFTPKKTEATKGFILYPGAKVDSRAYAPLCKKIAEQGYEVIIVDMPFNFAMLAPNKAQKIMKEYENIQSWVIGGHSLGGVAASRFAAKEKNIDGVVLLASYPGNDDLKQLGKEVVSIWGSKDGVVNFTKLIQSKERLPEDTTYVEIEGANHAQFGDYGDQKGDHDALISEDKQLEITSNSIIKLLDNIGNN